MQLLLAGVVEESEASPCPLQKSKRQDEMRRMRAVERQLRYCKRHPERVKKYNAEWKKAHTDHVRRYAKHWRSKHPERIKLHRRKHYLRHKTAVLEQGRIRYMMNGERIRKRARELLKTHRSARQKNWNKRYYSDAQFAIRCRLSGLVRTTLKRYRQSKKERTVELIGCSLSHFCAHLESLFLPGMTWENRSLWHIDHRHPVSLFNLFDEVQRKQAFHWTNLQPLWAKDNLLKSNKVMI